MSLQPKGSEEIPAETVRVARAVFPKGSLVIRVRDELGPLFTDEQFADVFPARKTRLASTRAQAERAGV